MTSERTLRVLVVSSAAAIGLLVVVAAVLDVAGNLTFAMTIQSFQLTNLMLGLPATVCGTLLAWHRPGRRLGWFLVAAGLATAVMAVSVPLLVIGFEQSWPFPILRTLSTTYTTWTACQFLFLPLAVLYFPDDRLPGRTWRAVPMVVAIVWIIQVLRFSPTINSLDTVSEFAALPAPSWLSLDGWQAGLPFTVVGGGLELGVYVLLLISMAVRYRDGGERTRRQILWLLWALSLAVVLIVVDLTAIDVGASAAILALGLIGLVPVAMTVAVLRYELLDIRLVWSRTAAWAVLTVGVLVIYAVLVELVDWLLGGRIPASVPAALLLAVVFHPARMRLQRLVDIRLYGERHDPVRAVAAFAAELADGATTPGDLLAPIRLGLRLPYAELRQPDGGAVTSGEPVGATEVIPLTHAGVGLGDLIVGVRLGQRRLDTADRTVLTLIAAPLALALHAMALARSVQSTAEAISASRRDERRRLRNDLHDGLGPLLTGIVFHAEAADNLIGERPDDARPLVRRLRESAAEAIVEVRTLIEQLRPASIEDHGLVAAIEEHAAGLARRADGSVRQIVVEGRELPPLPTDVETALFRLAAEGLTNAARHADPERVDVEIWVENREVVLTVHDDGGSPHAWVPGIGLQSMHDRVDELGGRVSAGPGRIGGEVRASIPLSAGSGS